MPLVTKMLAGLALLAAAFAGVVGICGTYLLLTREDDALGIKVALGQMAIGASVLYALVAVGVLLVVRRSHARR